jgi:hypothetical protein
LSDSLDPERLNSGEDSASKTDLLVRLIGVIADQDWRFVSLLIWANVGGLAVCLTVFQQERETYPAAFVSLITDPAQMFFDGLLAAVVGLGTTWLVHRTLLASIAEGVIGGSHASFLESVRRGYISSLTAKILLNGFVFVPLIISVYFFAYGTGGVTVLIKNFLDPASVELRMKPGDVH